jgi:hypothetical protein
MFSRNFLTCGWRTVLLALCVSVSAQAQMALPGKFEVTDTGSASYTIPISIVPGTAGLEPKLSLQYDSRNGNGLLGVGWSLAGLPAITRCGRTIAQDGQTGGVAYDTNDRFCLDGQRLIAISGTYGADQTEYRTERESFSKVVSYGSAGSGPSWFKVWTKAGLVMEFGNTADSKIEAQGKTSVRVWALNRTSDTKGNYFTVSYTDDNANDEYRPDRIDYTGNAAANTPPNNSVRFVYETRPDIALRYQGGSRIKTTVRLTKVQVWQGNSMSREYRAAYDVGADSKQSRTVSISMCLSSVGDCLASLVLNVEQASGAGISVIEVGDASAPTSMGSVKWVGIPGDFNGDGKADVLWYYADGIADAQFRMWLSNTSGSYDVNPTAGDQSALGVMASVKWYAIPGDFNGDGKLDILWRWADGVTNAQHRLWLNQGNGTFSYNNDISSPVVLAAMAGRSWTPFMGDFNGDGVGDIFWRYADGQWAGQFKVWLGQQGGTFQIIDDVGVPNAGNTFASPTWTAQLGDFNGDGISDVFWRYADGTTASHTIWFGKADGSFTELSCVGCAQSVPDYMGGRLWKHYIADYNGDGASDIFWRLVQGGYAYRYMWIGKGDGTFAIDLNVAGQNGNFSGESWQQYVGDFNGDGRADVLWDNQAGQRSLWRGLPDGTMDVIADFGGQNGQFASTSWKAMLLDSNGDGKADLLWRFANGTANADHKVMVTLPQQPDALKAVETSGGAITSIISQPLSGSSFYAKDTGGSACAYPCVDVQGPLWVTKEVKSTNGLGISGAGGEYRSTYRYAGAKADQHGRGFLGFRQMTVRDEQTGVEQVTTYRQDYPFTGLGASREKKLGTQLLNRSSNTYGSTDLGGTRRYPFLTLSLEESWELTGAALPAVTTSYQYDAWGNATQVGVSTGDGHSKVTNNTYSNDATNWLLGRLTRSEVTSTTPGN